ncbi:hypothetical protein Sjap_024740 [Stephania japonica]|uniref:GTD-binding domain-containing protein n=1 Tax=Stephania japonica TaxID=461633 RepID=A0AAP0EJB0_9MAGN
MAANKFATILHRNTNKFVVILTYTVLEWILILLLLLNSLFSYLILKFAEYFGLKPPCLWCSRIDHIFEPSNGKSVYKDFVCESHAGEICKLGFCSNHRKLVESGEMCEDCSSSRPSFNGKIALFSWVDDVGVLKSNGEKEVENGEKSLMCSCCGVGLNREFCKSYLLIKPSWGVLDYAQKRGFVDDHHNDGGESSDPCKSDCPTDRFDDEFDSKRTREDDDDDGDDEGGEEEEEEDHVLDDDNKFDVSVGVQNEEEEDEEEGLRSPPSSFRYKLIRTDEDDDGDGDEDRIGEIGEEFIKGDDSSSVLIEDMSGLVRSRDIVKIELSCVEDATCEIIPMCSNNFASLNDEPIDYLSAFKDESVPLLGNVVDEKERNFGGHENSEFEEHKQNELAIDVEEEEMKLRSMDESKDDDLIRVSLKSIDTGKVGITTSDAVTEAMPVQFSEGDNVGAAASMAEVSNSMQSQASEEDGLEMLDRSESLLMREIPPQESTDLSQVRECNSSPQDLLVDRSSSYGKEVDDCSTFADDNDQLDSLQAKEMKQESENVPIDQTEKRINHQLSLCSEFNEVDEDRTPETPTSVESLHILHKKLLLFERKESGTEESLDGSVTSEMETGEGVLTVDRLKAALKTERKVLNALYAELEEERSASAVAANQTMAMITRLQEEKAAMQMEALQYQRMMEEQSEYDQEALQLLNELMIKREREKQELEKELEMYRKKVIQYETKEKKMRNKAGSGRSRTSSASSSVDSDELSIDLGHEGAEEDGFFRHHESNNHNTPVHDVLNLDDMGLETAQHLSTLDESLADFEDERQAILEQLKALEEKLFMLDDNDEQYEDVRPVEHMLEADNPDRFNDTHEIDDLDAKGSANGFSDELERKHYQARRNVGVKGKTLLPLFDAISLEDKDEELKRNLEVANHMVSQPATPDYDKRLAIEEEVDHVYERLQALEADREFLKHCISSLKKGDKGMDLLQEILQHLRDLRSVELRCRNMGDAFMS